MGGFWGGRKAQAGPDCGRSAAGHLRLARRGFVQRGRLAAGRHHFLFEYTIWRVAASGDTPEAVTTLDEKKSEFNHLWPQVLPGGKAVLFTVQGPTSLNLHIGAQSLQTHQRWDLTQRGTYARYAANGYLIYSEYPPPAGSFGSLLARAVDLERRRVAGPEMRILDNVWVSDNGSSQFALSANGTLIYALGGAPRPATLVWVDHMEADAACGARRVITTGRGCLPTNERLALTIEMDARQTFGPTIFSAMFRRV